MNIKKKGLYTKPCVCKGKIVRYVILPLLNNMQRRKGIHHNVKNGMHLGGI